MSTGENKLPDRRCFEEVGTPGNLAVGDELSAAIEDESLCQGRCNHEPILNWPPWLNELQRTTPMSAGEQTPTKLRQNQVIPTPTHKRRLPNASRLAASGAQSHFR